LDDNISQARRFAEEKSQKESRKKSIGASHRLMPQVFSLLPYAVSGGGRSISILPYCLTQCRVGADRHQYCLTRCRVGADRHQ